MKSRIEGPAQIPSLETKVLLSIIIVNWNSGARLRDCVQSIASAWTPKGTRIVIVDNASTDDSIDFVSAAAYDIDVSIIVNEVNAGFAKACNQGASQCNSKYLLFLNPDTRLFSDSISVAFLYMEGRDGASCGICGIQLVDSGGATVVTCSRFPTMLRIIAQALRLNLVQGCSSLGVKMLEWDHATERAVDQVIGAYFFVRSSVYAELEGFDERFFVYYEEVDFSLRANREGWTSAYLPGARAFHLGGGESGLLSAERLCYSLHSRILYVRKHFGIPSRVGVYLFMTMAEPVARIAYSTLRGGYPSMANVVRGYWALISRVLISHHRGRLSE